MKEESERLQNVRSNMDNEIHELTENLFEVGILKRENKREGETGVKKGSVNGLSEFRFAGGYVESYAALQLCRIIQYGLSARFKHSNIFRFCVATFAVCCCAGGLQDGGRGKRREGFR